jgi:hypothetical protein
VKTRNVLLAGGLAIAALVAFAVLALHALEDPPRPRAGAGTDDAPADRTAVAPAPGPAPAPPLADPSAVAPPAAAPAPAAAGVPWDRVPVATRSHELGRGLARPWREGLDEAHRAMSHCFAEESSRRASGQAPPPPEGASQAEPPALVLSIEAHDGALQIVGSEVAALNGHTPEFVDCARAVLDGWTVQVPEARAGRRYRLRYLIQ